MRRLSDLPVLLFFFSVIYVFPAWTTGPIAGDLVVEPDPRADVRKTYGADNTGVVDFSAAVKAACDNVLAAGGDTVFLRPGTYLQTNQVVIRNAKRLKIVGAGARIIFSSGTNARNWPGNIGWDIRNCGEVVFDGIEFDSNYAIVTDLASPTKYRFITIQTQNVAKVTVRRCTFKHTFYHNVSLLYGEHVEVRDNDFIDNFDFVGQGADITENNESPIYSGVGDKGVFIGSGNRFVNAGNIVKGRAGASWYIANGNSVLLEDNYHENVGTAYNVRDGNFTINRATIHGAIRAISAGAVKHDTATFNISNMVADKLVGLETDAEASYFSGGTFRMSGSRLSADTSITNHTTSLLRIGTNGGKRTHVTVTDSIFENPNIYGVGIFGDSGRTGGNAIVYVSLTNNRYVGGDYNVGILSASPSGPLYIDSGTTLDRKIPLARDASVHRAGGAGNATAPPVAGFFNKGDVVRNMAYASGNTSTASWICTTEGGGYAVKGTWTGNTAYTAGDYTSYAGRIYQAMTSGTSGTISPEHTFGVVSDGAVSWNFIATKSVAVFLPVRK